MEYVVSAKQMKEYDRYTIEECNVPSLVLMENAALSVKEEICNRFSFDQSDNPLTVLIAVGMGNNGGDGLALARMLKEEGWIVELILLGDESKSTTEWKIQKNKLDSLSPIYSTKPNKDEYTVIVDAIFGIGLTRDVTGIYEDVIESLNAMSGFKVAVDIASGINADTGAIMNVAFGADITVTFGYLKLGHCLGKGRVCSGKVVVKDIGISKLATKNNPPSCYMYNEDIMSLLPKRSKDGNKGTFGKVLIIAGFEYMAGAAILAAKAAYRTGCGMVKVISPLHNREIIQTAIPEVLYGDVCDLEVSLDWCDVIAIGPGLGTSELAKNVLISVLSRNDKPVVIDADAINLIAANPDIFYLTNPNGNISSRIFTPHMGELSRLLNISVLALKQDVLSFVKKFVDTYRSTLVCKDASTVVFDGNYYWINNNGNSGMATAGSGDVLTGIIASLLAQGLDTSHAAAVGVYLHGLAGDKAANNLNEYSVMAGDIVDCISCLLEE